MPAALAPYSAPCSACTGTRLVLRVEASCRERVPRLQDVDGRQHRRQRRLRGGGGAALAGGAAARGRSRPGRPEWVRLAPVRWQCGRLQT